MAETQTEKFEIQLTKTEVEAVQAHLLEVARSVIELERRVGRNRFVITESRMSDADPVLMRVEMEPSKSLNPWGKKSSKYPGNCSYCGTKFEPGTIVWVTVGYPPRCASHGNPNLQPYPNDDGCSVDYTTKDSKPKPR